MKNLWRLGFLIAFLLVSGCAQQTFTKEEYVKYFATTGAEKFVEAMKTENAFYFYCFDQEHKQSEDIILGICSSCAYDYDWIIKSDLVTGEDKNFTDKLSHCLFTRYINKNFSYFNKDKFYDRKCRQALFMYVISNNKNTENVDIFQFYYDSVAMYTILRLKDDLICFDRSDWDLENDLKKSLKIGLEELREKYYGKYPADDKNLDNITHLNTKRITMDFF